MAQLIDLHETSMNMICVHSENGERPHHAQVQVSWAREADFFTAEFRVQGSEPIRTSTDLPPGNWGLWEFDVTEIFIRPLGLKSYFEFQLSPLGQKFELEILEPRKTWDSNYRSNYKARAKILGETEWLARFEIPLTSIHAHVGVLLEGNFFAILGSPGSRTYWSTYLPESDQPDFHQPRFFKQIG